ncbi:MAG: META domain-containing protein [Oscillatoriales cyanobacterium RM1_1_9]|nr:META domain-containing protein [Oscillatoriales cyanobacterium RM1_1_9]
MTQEFQYLRALEGATRYELDAQGQLQIVYSQGEISGVLTFKPQSIDSLDGSSWTLQTWDDPQSPDFPLAETAITLSFAEGRIAGSSGCNRYMAAYEVEGNRLKVDTPAGTLKACPEPIMGQESKFLAALTHIQNYQITPDQQLKIIYQTPNHSGAMVFIPDSSSN